MQPLKLHDQSYSVLAIGGNERSLRNSTAHLLCNEVSSIVTVEHPLDQNEVMYLFSCTDDEYSLYASNTQEYLSFSTDCEPELSTERSCNKMSTANCEPDFIAFSNGQCNSPCLPYSMRTPTVDTSSGSFYWSETDPKLLVDTYEELENLRVVQNFQQTSYKEAAMFSLECSPTTKQWVFQNSEHR